MPALSHSIDFQREMRPLLVSAYERGRLVPFLGAGMSFPACQLWDGFLENLEKGNIRKAPPELRANPAARAHLACIALRNRLQSPEYWQRLREALKTDHSGEIPAQTEALARIWWPLVITTNYDDLFLTASNRYTLSPSNRRSPRQPMTVLGRHPLDCRRVLSSLTEPLITLDDVPYDEGAVPGEAAAARPVTSDVHSEDSGRYIWHIQGFLGGQADPSATPEQWAKAPRSPGLPSPRRLLADLVVGHAEYRRAMNLEMHFRRSFGEVFRQRSFLFVGSSLSEDYFLNLFGEILELFGASSYPHFALVKRGSVEKRFLLERMNIMVCEYREHGELPSWLDSLRRAIDGERCRPVRWSFNLKSPFWSAGRSHEGDFSVVRSALPFFRRLEKNECVAVSAGRGPNGVPWVGFMIRATYLSRQIPGLDRMLGQSRLPKGGYVTRLGRKPCYIVAARDPDLAGRGARSLKHVNPAVRALLNRALRDGFEVVHLQLLAAGRLQVFPATFSLIEIARAYGQWRRRHMSSNVRLVVYVVDPLVLFNVSTGRTQVQELLSVEPARFWVEVICENKQVVRIPVEFPCGTQLCVILNMFRVPASQDWHVVVRPAPQRAEPGEARDTAALAGETMTELGVVPGSTLMLVDARPAGPETGEAE
jgi:hypothetical protein